MKSEFSFRQHFITFDHCAVPEIATAVFQEKRQVQGKSDCLIPDDETLARSVFPICVCVKEFLREARVYSFAKAKRESESETNEVD